jgi:phage baseplate assembly protein W
MPKLSSPRYLAFPFRVAANGAEVAERARHVRDQIEQVLFTNPGERVFRPEFGAGIRALVFEPNTSALGELTRKRLLSSLAEALQGEVDPRSLTVDVAGEGEKLTVVIAYALSTIGHSERHEIPLGSGGGNGG